MDKIIRTPFLGSRSDNPKSKMGGVSCNPPLARGVCGTS